MSNKIQPQIEDISSLIRTIRGQKVILDADLARLYGVPTKALNQAVKRNLKRFPDDFIFYLTREELENLKSQIVTSSSHGGPRKLPYAFTENGAIMAANVLNSPQAVRMSVFVVRAFVQMRELLGGTKELAKELAALEKKLTERLDGHEAAIIEVLQWVMDILDRRHRRPNHPNRQDRGLVFRLSRKGNLKVRLRKSCNGLWANRVSAHFQSSGPRSNAYSISLPFPPAMGTACMRHMWAWTPLDKLRLW